MSKRNVLIWIMLLAATPNLRTAEAPKNEKHILRLEGKGPTAFVTSLALSPDGKTLYSAGYDKVVRTYTLNEKENQYTLDSTVYRIPIGPGLGGVINTIALSKDGRWLAIAGTGVVRGTPGFDEPGWTVPTEGGMTPEMREDLGTIYVVDTTTKKIHRLRGHRGELLALAFEFGKHDDPYLVSGGRDWDAKNRRYEGAVRLWRISEEKIELVGRLGGLPNPYNEEVEPPLIIRPAFSAWRTAKGQPWVAIAWEDSKGADRRIRLWNGGAREPISAPDGYFNSTVALVPGRGLLTASYRGWRKTKQYHGYLQEWSLGTKIQAKAEPVVRTIANHIPLAMATVSSEGNGTLDYVALVLQDNDMAEGQPTKYYLQLVDLEQGSTIFKKPLPLWEGETNTPVLATCARGKHLAIAGNGEHTIVVFTVEELLRSAKLPEPNPGKQILQSVGEKMRSVGFVRKGEARGLSMQGMKDAEPLIFELKNRRLTENRAGWNADEPDTKPFRVRWSSEAHAFFVEGMGPKPFTIELRPKQYPISGVWALWPDPDKKHSLLAVGYVDQGEPKLGLFHVEKRRQIRNYAGHVDYVRTLAFSKDGRLLASAGDDQTVCVWTLTNVHTDILDKHGQLPGVSVVEDDKGVRVAQVGKAYEGKLKPNDVIQEVRPTRAKRVADKQAVDNPEKFYGAIWQIPPGSGKAILRINGRDVTVDVGQGVDQQPPLFSLFVTRGGETLKRQWIGWAPNGMYDASGPRIEPSLGWHRNLQDNENPVEFVRMNEFRNRSLKVGILEDLVQHANIGDAEQIWKARENPPAPEPNTKLDVEEGAFAVPIDDRGEYLVKRRDVALTFTLRNRFPPESVGSLEWKSEGQTGKFSRIRENAWSADLSGIPWSRGTRKIDVTLTTKESPPRVFPSSVTLRYEPPPPDLFVDVKFPLVPKKEGHALLVKVTPGRDQKVQMRVFHSAGKTETVLLDKQNLEEATSLEVPVKLAPGVNAFRVEAENQDAPKETLDKERVVWKHEVTYRVPRPQVHLVGLQTTVAGEVRTVDLRRTRTDEVLVVESPHLRVLGEIASTVPLAQAHRQVGKSEAKSLAEFDATKKPTTQTIDESIDLSEPGKPIPIRISASVAGRDDAESKTILVKYRPLLPTITVLSPNGQPLYWDTSPLRVPLKLHLTWPQKEMSTAKLVVTVNGEQQIEKEGEAGTTNVEGMIQLRPGENEVVVSVSNPWQAEPNLQRVSVPYRRPPQIRTLVGGETFDSPPRAEVRATVVTPRGMPLQRALLTSAKPGAQLSSERKKLEVPASAMKKLRQEAETDVWEIHVLDVPLDEGPNVVTLEAVNADGSSRTSPKAEFEYKKPPPSKAEIRWVRPYADPTLVTSPIYRVKFNVASASPLTHVQIVRGNDILHSLEGEPLAGFQQRIGEGFQAEIELDVDLVEGDNVLNVFAGNAGGTQPSSTKTITYESRPVVRIQIERVQPSNQGQQMLPREVDSRTETLLFDPVATGEVQLVGHVSWNARDNEVVLRALRHLAVTVNGQKQVPVELNEIPGKRYHRKIRTPVFLTGKDQHNDIVLDLPRGNQRLVIDSSSLRRCSIECAKPAVVDRQLALVLIVSLTDPNVEAVKQRALNALGATNVRRTIRGEQFDLDYCLDGGLVFATLVGGQVTEGKVYHHLDRMEQEMVERAKDGALNDVMMVYYEGRQTIHRHTHYLDTLQSVYTNDPLADAIPYETLASRLGEIPGAHLLWLDVERKPGVAPGNLLVRRLDDPLVNAQAPNMALFRYSWSVQAGKRAEQSQLWWDLERDMKKTTTTTLAQLQLELSTRFVKPDSPERLWMSKRFKGSLFYDDYLPQSLKSFPLRSVRSAP